MSIENRRKRIGEIDAHIAQLLDERLRVAQAIGQEKKRKGDPYFVPAQEEKKIGNISALLKNFPKSAFERAFREIIGASRSAQKRHKIGFIGPPTSLCHLAALYRFGVCESFVTCPSTVDAVTRLEQKELDLAVVPLENIVGDVVSETMELLSSAKVRIVAECPLILRPREKPLRFMVLGLFGPKQSGEDKTALLFDPSPANWDFLDFFKSRGIEVVHHGPVSLSGEPHFFVEVLGFPEEGPLAGALSDLARHAGTVKVLGTYPTAATERHHA